MPAHDFAESPGAAHQALTVAHSTCLGCGCACDDIELTVAGGRVAHAGNACDLGAAWFAGQPEERPLARVQGRVASLEEAADAAAGILARARFPLVYGLGGASIEAQRQAVALAESIGGTIDPAGPVLDGAAGLAFQNTGWSTATLGELRARADLLVFWRADPMTTHPRHLSRYSLEPRGLLVPNGRRDRTLVVVDSHRSATARQADIFLQVRPGWDFELLWALRALLRKAPVDPALEAQVGLGSGSLAELARRLQDCRYGAFLFGAELAGGGHLQAHALLALVAELNRFTHFVALPLRREGNAAGAEDVLAWQTGYPFAVNFSRGYPRSNPGEFSATGLLARGEVDAALIVASDPLAHLQPAAAEHLRRIPTVVVDSRRTATAAGATVAFFTGAYSVECAGTVHRMDGVPVELRSVLPPSRPGDERVLNAIAGSITRLRDG